MKELIAALITAVMVTACGSGGADPVTTTGPAAFPTTALESGAVAEGGSSTTVTSVAEEPDATTSTTITTLPDVDEELAEFDALADLLDELDDLLADL